MQGTGSDAQHTQASSGDVTASGSTAGTTRKSGGSGSIELLSLTRKVMNQAQRVLEEVEAAQVRRWRRAFARLAESLETIGSNG